MKRILITGADSYIGTSFERWLKRYGNKYQVNTVSTLDDEWNKKDFTGYDVVFHVAGIAHVDVKKGNKELYYKVNRDLTIKIAKKARQCEVRQFIFMSSIIVYGEHYTLSKPMYITMDTVPKPTNYYGMSKLMAEKGILPLQSDDFNVVVIRAPMIYGKGSKENYPKLVKFVSLCPVFPDIRNRRSMLYVDNLCEFVRLMIDNEEKGIFFPQNREHVGTVELVREIARAKGKRIIITKSLNPIIRILCLIDYSKKLVSKMFGNMAYHDSMSLYKDEYRIYGLAESVRLSES